MGSVNYSFLKKYQGLGKLSEYVSKDNAKINFKQISVLLNLYLSKEIS